MTDWLADERRNLLKGEFYMLKTNTKKMAIAGIFCAVAVAGSLFSFPN